MEDRLVVLTCVRQGKGTTEKSVVVWQGVVCGLLWIDGMSDVKSIKLLSKPPRKGCNLLIGRAPDARYVT